MPIYEFRCLECGDIFEELVMNTEENAGLKCPGCSSYTFERVVSRSSYAMGPGSGGNQAKVTTKSCGSGNQCMTLDLPGHSK